MSTPVPPCPKSRRRLMVLLGFCIWVCGIAVGAGGVLLYSHMPEEGVTVGTQTRRGRGPEDIARYLREAYQLTDEEVEGVRVIYEETFSKLRDLRRSIQPDVDAVYDEHAETMRLLLGEERYERWHADIERKRRRVGQGRVRSMERRMRAGPHPGMYGIGKDGGPPCGNDGSAPPHGDPLVDGDAVNADAADADAADGDAMNGGDAEEGSGEFGE